MLAHREQTDLAKKLIEQTIGKQDFQRDQLVIHSDRGSSMISHSVANLLCSLGVTKSLGRPHVSNDNPYSESQFKTMKYQPELPDRFGSYEDALAHCRSFFGWYNDEHYHSGIGLITPASWHHGSATGIIPARTGTLSLAYAARPERFVNGIPKPAQLPTAAWINPPARSPVNEKRPPEIHCPEGPPEASLTHPRFSYPSAGQRPRRASFRFTERRKLNQQKYFEHPSHA